MRLEISELHQKLGTTMISVTHDQAEALTMADRIVVLQSGPISSRSAARWSATAGRTISLSPASSAARR